MNTPMLPPPKPAAELKVQTAGDPDYVAVYVEGPTDVALWKRWLRWKPISKGGKSNVLQVVQNLSDQGRDRFVAIIDADFERADRTLVPRDNVVVSECHDIEGDLFRTGVWRIVLDCASDCEVDDLTTIESRVCSLSAEYGYLRWLFARAGHTYKQDRFTSKAVLRAESLELVHDALLTEVEAVCGISKAQVQAELDYLRLMCVDAWQLRNGHELLYLLALALSRFLKVNTRLACEESLRAAMLAALTDAHIKTLTLWKELDSWEQRTGFKVLRSG